MSATVLRRLLTALLALLALPAPAHQEGAEIRRAVEDFLRAHTRGLPGETSFTIGMIDGNNLAPCAGALEVFLPAATRPWGRISVGVRCRREGGWALFVPVQVKVIGDYYVAARPLARGQSLGAADLERRRGDLAELPPGVVTDAQQAVGRTLTVGVPAGQLLRSEFLRPPLAVRQGQGVRVVSAGPGFSVSTEGKALNNAAEGEVVQVRTASGQTVSGIARGDGTVEVKY